MKTNKRFLVMMAASLLMATSVLASEVNVIKKLNGVVVTDNSAGTVAPTVNVQEGTCSLVVTPATGNYVTVDYITAERIIDAGMAQAPRRRSPEMSNMITVSAVAPDADPSGETSYTFPMPTSEDYDVEVVVDFQTRTSISTGSLALTLPEGGYYFDGNAKEPAVTVTLNSSVLAATNYSVAYENNTVAGQATVTVTGIKTYQGTLTQNFTINKAALTNLSVSLEDWTFGAQANTPVVQGNLGEGEETFTYKTKSGDTFSSTVPTNAGDYVVKVSVAESDNYAAGEATAEFSISKAELTNASVSLEGWTYGDAANTPAVTGNLGNGTVTYTYANAAAPSLNYTSDVPVNAGNYSVKAAIAETDNYLAKEVTNTFSIAKADLADVTIEAIADQDYTGQAIEPAVVVKFKGNVVSEDEYTVIYENNTKVGVATVKLSTKHVNFYEPDIQPSQTFNILGTPLTISYEWSTYLASEDLTIPAGLNAYVVASVNGRSVKAEKITYIPKNVAILIELAEEQDQYVATPYRGEELTYTSMLQGAASAVNVSTLTAENDIFVLYNGEFVKTTSGTIPANRCYLPVAKGQAAGSRLSIIFDDEATGVSSVSAQSQKMNGVYYNLSGQRISQPARGLYIINGKKVLMK